MKNKKIGNPLSDIRKRYIARLVGRIFILIMCVAAYLKETEMFDIAKGWNFFKKFSLLHVLWFIWLIDIFAQMFPIKKHLALGSMKIFKNRYRPIKEIISPDKIKKHIIEISRTAYKVFFIWAFLLVCIGMLFVNGIIDEPKIFLITVLFYVCDLICVLIWCPFRVIMKNKCCTTCRIFNWDHWMMFSPMIFIRGFYSWSLVFMSILAWGAWEICVIIHPERFWEETNQALKCSECTDKLCIQYCGR